MSPRGGGSIRSRLNRAVRALCPLVEREMSERPPRPWGEYELRRELVGCILGSQVGHGMAIAATQNLEYAGLLHNAWWSRPQEDDFGPLVLKVLSGQRPGLPHSIRYRFFRTRSEQLIDARNALARRPLGARLTSGESPLELRQSLVTDIAGVGPKQASMFLRNTDVSHNLAILDRHVLRFLDLQDLLLPHDACIGTLSAYEKTERVVISYASTVGYTVGCVDLAIWATMKAARELGW